MGCEYSVLRPRDENVPWWRKNGFWSQCGKGLNVNDGAVRTVTVKEAPAGARGPVAVDQTTCDVLNFTNDDDDPSTAELAIIEDLRTSGLLTIRPMTPMMAVTEHGRPMTPVTAAAGGCSFEVPLDDAGATPIQKPPARLAKLIHIPKVNMVVKKSKAQKKEELITKLMKAEIRKEEINNKIRQQGLELQKKINMAKTVIASDDDLRKMTAEAKVLAKAAIHANVKQELLEKRLAKIQAREDKRNKVMKKKRSNRIKELGAKIRRENKVAPMPVAESVSPSVPAQAPSPVSRPMTPAEWESISYTWPVKRH